MLEMVNALSMLCKPSLLHSDRLQAVLPVLSLDASDASGEHSAERGFAKNGEVHKIRLNAQGERIGLGEYIPPVRYGFMMAKPRQV
jgi:hypothetical protein